ncbi:LysR family transcriptional regulator [Actinoallomurus soli]|uniref:LysR family transcriptional regulator n=1 Tax=Actinoallomurus soli TaxID=2952535 RepID=UPI00209263DA|nr:LysR family transcriptional regulator [Actinoallomurus soli]MCO5968372.1 LysR family transcriptional regulator [Actinoallomurus soli]
MELLQLYYFQTVARREHISRAAEELRVAQPSLSRTIARLEAELGVPLFDRHGRRIRLNHFGALFLARVDRALGELDDARRELADAAGLDLGTVSIAAENLQALSDLLAAFLRDHPGVNVRLSQSSAPVMLRQLAAGEVDLCLASQPLPGSYLRSVEIRREEVLLAVPPHHPLAGRSEVGVPALADEPFVTTRPGYWQRSLLDRLFADAGLEPAIACEGDEPAAIRSLISAGLGIGLLPAAAYEAAAGPSVAWLRIDAPDCHRVLRLVHRDDGYLSAAARSLRDVATEHFRTAG